MAVPASVPAATIVAAQPVAKRARAAPMPSPRSVRGAHLYASPSAASRPPCHPPCRRPPCASPTSSLPLALPLALPPLRALDMSRCAPRYSPSQLRRALHRLSAANTSGSHASLHVSTSSVAAAAAAAAALPQHVVIALEPAAAAILPPGKLRAAVRWSWPLSLLLLLLVVLAAVYTFAPRLFP
eukprot:gb/GEZJ01002659.1/.p2 GENE.gb/GEZJ01002659.1/~~gb/GEZJ01002659.1/.p2  ORF type:complete len:206 (-),score=39.21 gb/GEZJ01002659.1/:468-1019(-)